MKSKKLKNTYEMFSDFKIEKSTDYYYDILYYISRTITDLRISEELTQVELAEKMGVSQVMVSKWESGDYNFTIKQLSEICEKINYMPELALKPIETPKTKWIDDDGSDADIFNGSNGTYNESLLNDFPISA